MGAQHDAFLGLGIEHADDVLPVDSLTVIKTRTELLHDDRVGKLSELGREPCGAVGMGLGFGHARSELGLFGHKLVG